ncbi:uncharacterized protein LOC127261174 [Andrographis paniculata]|uniref:uncharacterized protein LOC127261174 n=1 Tax=Andrographis paniculata TaxID=175694 RepID=UPI0021E76EC3|nr:uncharacterized protein LOC127261174 [Andrographis paniculata]
MTMVVESFLHEEPSSPYVRVFYAASFLAFVAIAVSEFAGNNLQYAKLLKSGRRNLIPSKVGMLIFYFPALVLSVSSFWLFPGAGIRFLLLKSALTIHLLKRLFEVLFIHKFSGAMVLNTAILVSISYIIFFGGMNYFQHRIQRFPEPSIDLKYVGALLFVVGNYGNFYHHYLLSKLRREGEKEYKIPQGGLFNLVICPHYFCEILTFIGIAFIAQTFFAVMGTIGDIICLFGRSYTTRKWYLSKFEDFPNNVKALIPYIF